MPLQHATPDRAAKAVTKPQRARSHPPLQVRESDLAAAVGATEWAALTPRTPYVRFVRPGLEALLLAVGFFPALFVMTAVALANAVAHRGLGRVFFFQDRVGLHGRVFRLVKFRTMRDAGESAFDSWSGGDAARVTPFGRFLRNTHLDELPQLWNVLAGDMSLIGPRPEMLEVEEWAAANVPGFTARLAMRPGLTGLAQITQGYTGRDVESYQAKLELCERYRREISFATDLEILARTAVWMLRGRGWSWNRRSSSRASR